VMKEEEVCTWFLWHLLQKAFQQAPAMIIRIESKGRCFSAFIDITQILT
jgi:hypothetical protein